MAEVQREGAVGGGRKRVGWDRGGWGVNILLTGGPQCWLWVWRRVIKEDGCGRIEDKGKNLADRDGIFCLEEKMRDDECGWS
jgi:hypothetical protein